MGASRHVHNNPIKPKSKTIIRAMLQAIIHFNTQTKHKIQHCHIALLQLHRIVELSIENRNIVSIASIAIEICLGLAVEL